MTGIDEVAVVVVDEDGGVIFVVCVVVVGIVNVTAGTVVASGEAFDRINCGNWNCGGGVVMIGMDFEMLLVELVIVGGGDSKIEACEADGVIDGWITGR